MQIIENTTEFHIREKTAIAIGKFDGIHMGHKELFKKLDEAKKNGLKTAIFTFSPSPASFFTGQDIPELTTKEEKRSMFEAMGVDYLVEYPFAKETAAVSPEDYVEDFLLNKMNAKLVVAGTDVSFGKGGLGNLAFLQEISNQKGFDLEIVDKVKLLDREISSSYIREELKKGNMELVTQLIGIPYFVTGIVESGKKLGRTLGMPTANLYPGEDKMLPPFGVYFCEVILENGDTYNGITNIGLRPTVKDENKVSVETFLINFDENLYGKMLKVNLLHFHRSEQKFKSVDELKETVLKNIEEAKAYFEK